MTTVHKPELVLRYVTATHATICAGCGYSHSNVHVGPNYWHDACWEQHTKEFHNPPEDLVQRNRSKE